VTFRAPLELSHNPEFRLSRIGVTGLIKQMKFAAIHRDCPVCDSHAAQPHWQKGELRIVHCDNCGMVYANPVPSEMASGAFYDAEGADYYLSPAKLESDYADVRFERELRLFRNHCPRGAVLDVGCSSGAFLFQLRKHWPANYQILGTDVSGPPLEYAESRGVPVVQGNFLGSAEPQLRSSPQSARAELEFRAPFDAVTFWAVIEHLAAPKKFLAKAHTLLKPGGVCLVLVPNLRSLAVRLLGSKYRYVYAQHLNYFSAQTLSQLGNHSGFEVIATSFTHFNPAVIWQDWRRGGREVSNAERGELLRQTTALKQKPWMKPLKWCYGLTEKSLGFLGLTDNVVVVFQKRC
jgi:2-polyprenyl-3-methyl-5-hydroxy-6-metoxy-1,4-benzoquinol methylase